MKRIIESGFCRIGAVGGAVLALTAIPSSAYAQGAVTFTIGGAVYTDLSQPHISGLEGAEVCVTCDGGFSGCALTSAGSGTWLIVDVPEDTCTVNVSIPGWCFSHVVNGQVGDAPPITIVVNEANKADNLRIQFLASEGVCCADADCDDGDPCTEDACVDGECVHAPMPNGTACDDGNACTDGDLCTDGACSGTPVDCNDNDACTDDSCDPVTGECASTPVDCDDGSLCTDDSCDPATGCVNEPVDCDDGVFCNGAESCDPETGCQTGTPPDCQVNCVMPCCIHGFCNPETDECDTRVDPDETPCDDGDPNTCAACFGGNCVPAPDLFCNDGNACTDDACIDDGECVYTPIDCDDDNLCTDDSCDPATGECIHEPIDCGDDDLCTEYSCDPSVGCINEPKDCDDGEACTIDYCVDGDCMNTPLPCKDNEVCVDGACRRPCVGPDGTLCEDGFFCTINDVCIQGICMPGSVNPDCVGTACWDLDGDGIADPEEDTNGDGVHNALDCQGPPGQNGRDGQNGSPGVSCWDLDGDGVGDPEEDVNADGNFDALDCQGEQGQPGEAGSDGHDGTDGETGPPGVSCWDLNGNGVGDPDEDTNGDGNYDAFDCLALIDILTITVRTDPEQTGHPNPVANYRVLVDQVMPISVPDPPKEGLVFDHWEGDVPAERIYDDPLWLTMDEDKTVTAVFQEIPCTPSPCGTGACLAMMMSFLGCLGLRLIGRRTRPRGMG